MTDITDDMLPPLPDELNAVRCMIRGEMDYSEAGDYYYTRQQMRDYARAALAATGKQQVGEVESADDDWHLRGYAYASKQATTCASCGKHKHTPLRIDAMGGYVCLTCIDQKLGTLLNEFGCQSEQVGEVRGDEHVPVLRALRAILNESGRSSPARTAALDAAIAALADRQPVGHELVAMYQVRPRSFRDGAGWREVDKSEYDGGKSGHYPERDWERRTLYASPPAQGFDLGQFRSAVMGWRESLDQVVANTDIPGSDRRVAAGRVRECIRLLAMIDGRDAGAGVGDER